MIAADRPLRLDGRRLESADVLAATWPVHAERIAALERRRGPSDRDVLHVWADRRTRMSDVVRWTAGSGLHVLLLAHADSAPTPPRCPASLAALCRRPIRSSELVEHWTRALADCAPLCEGFASFANMPPDDRPAHLRRFLADGLRQCECDNADAEQLETLAFLTLGGNQREVRAFELDPSAIGPDASVADWIARR